MTARGLAAIALLLVLVAPAAAQEDTTATPVDSVIVTPEAPLVVGEAPDTTLRLPITPRAAFIRSMILPGWGQAPFDSYFRGGVFFAGWAANWFMNVRNYMRLDDARERRALREAQVVDSLFAVPPVLEDEPRRSFGAAPRELPLEAALRNDTIADNLRKLVDAREQQREDWIAWSIFWILASGVDGYVTAHLYDFPASIDLEPNRDGSVSVGLQVPFPRRRP